MRRLLSRWFGRRTVAQTKAYELGRQAGNATTADIVSTTDQLLLDRRRNFIAVLDGRLEAIREVEGVTFAEQAQIEFKVMLENWSERMAEQELEISAIIVHRWPKEVVEGSEDVINDLVHQRVGWHYGQLFSDGLDHAADAVTMRAGAK